MSMSEDSGTPPYKKSSGLVFPDHDDFEEMTVPQLRARIARKAGTQVKRMVQLPMSLMNSAYAYLTGEFFCHPRDINTQRSPGIEETRAALAAQVGLEDYPWEPENSRPFRKGELIQILESMYETPDQRGWTPDGK